MMSRDQLDQTAWAILEARKPLAGRPAGYAASGRPADLEELGQMVAENDDFDFSWSEFRQEFYRYKTVSFFEKVSPSDMDVERQAFLAAAAEALCVRFGLPVPEWTQDPIYTLPEPWDPSAMWYPGVSIESRIASSSPVFLKHNVLFADRGLIAL